MSKMKSFRFDESELEILEMLVKLEEEYRKKIELPSRKITETEVIKSMMIDGIITYKKRLGEEKVKELAPKWLNL